MTSIDYDEDGLNRHRVQTMITLPTEGDGILIFDDAGFAKQGNAPSASPGNTPAS